MKILFFRFYTTISIISLIFFSGEILSQHAWKIHFSGDANYWEHTDLYGGQISTGLEYRIKRIGISVTYGIGYGEYNRFKELDNVRFDRFGEVFVNHQQGREGFFNPNQTSDYARQHQFDLSVFYSLIKLSEKSTINLKVGAFYSIIHHYYIFDKVTFPFFEPQINAELDLLLISDQRFFTRGIRYEVNWEKKLNKLIISPYLALGTGPNFTNFGTMGFRIIGSLIPGKKN